MTTTEAYFALKQSKLQLYRQSEKRQNGEIGGLVLKKLRKRRR
jgi:hypothetical protein